MTRLLLQKDREILRQEYIFRFLNVAMSLGIISLVIMLVSLFPSFVSVSTRYDSLKTQYEDSNSEDILKSKIYYKEMSSTIDNFVESFDKNKYQISNLVDIIKNKESNLVSIRDYDIKVADEDKGIIIRGIANDRESLVSFAKSIGTEEIFEEVDVPVSSFTREVDLPFSLNINFSDE